MRYESYAGQEYSQSFVVVVVVRYFTTLQQRTEVVLPMHGRSRGRSKSVRTVPT